MKPIIIFGLWAVLGLDAGAWAEAILGVPAGVTVLVCVAMGAALAVAARRQIAARAASGPTLAATQVSPFEAPPALDRAA
jgi:hypothetical protein